MCPVKQAIIRGAAGENPLPGIFTGTRNERDLSKAQAKAHARGLGQFPAMPEQAETGNIRPTAQIKFTRQLAGFGIQGAHPADHLADILVRGQAALQGGGRRPKPERLGQNQHIPCADATFCQHLVRVDKAQGHQPKLGFLILNGMPTGNHHARRATFFRATAQDFTGNFHRQIGRQGRNIQRQEGLAAHRVNIRERIGRGDGAIFKRRIDHRGEKIGRHHQRALLIELPDRRIVRAIQSNQ